MFDIYIPPEYSSREKRLQKDHLKVLLETINNIRSENIILIRDFNARTKLYEDVISEKLRSFSSKFVISEPILGSDHCILKLTINLPKEIRIEERQEKSNIPRITS